MIESRAMPALAIQFATRGTPTWQSEANVAPTVNMVSIF